MDVEEPHFFKFKATKPKSKAILVKTTIMVKVGPFRDEQKTRVGEINDDEKSLTWLDPIIKYLKNEELAMEKAETKRL